LLRRDHATNRQRKFAYSLDDSADLMTTWPLDNDDVVEVVALLKEGGHQPWCRTVCLRIRSIINDNKRSDCKKVKTCVKVKRKTHSVQHVARGIVSNQDDNNEYN
jgi:hypothetical protein